MYAVVSAVELGQLLQTPPFHSGKIVRSGFICGFIELHPGGLEDLGSILAAPDGDQCIRLAVHKELGRLDPRAALGLGDASIPAHKAVHDRIRALLATLSQSKE